MRLRADVLKAYRHQLGLSQEAFALACIERQLCVSIASVKRAETGKPLLLRTAQHLALFHGLDWLSLLLTDDAPLVERAHHTDTVGHAGAVHPGTLIGRQHEMRVFSGLLDGVLAEPQSQVMLVQGRAGMGKSCLLAQMMGMARQQFMSPVLLDVQDGGGDHHRGVIARWLRHLLDLGEATPFWAQLVKQRLQPFRLSAEQMLVCRDLLALPMSHHERQTLQSVRHATHAQTMAPLLIRIIGRMALQRPMLLAIDDVHCASDGLIETLARVIHASQASQIMWVLSMRADTSQGAAALQRLMPEVAMVTLNMVPWKPPATPAAQHSDNAPISQLA